MLLLAFSSGVRELICVAYVTDKHIMKIGLSMIFLWFAIDLDQWLRLSRMTGNFGGYISRLLRGIYLVQKYVRNTQILEVTFRWSNRKQRVLYCFFCILFWTGLDA